MPGWRGFLDVFMESVLGAGARGCSAYVVGTVYVRHDRSVSRFLAVLKSRGAAIHYVDEVEGRVVFKLGLEAFASILEELRDSSAAGSYEVKLSCRASSGFPERLARLGSRVNIVLRDGGRGFTLAYIQVGERVVEAEVKGGKVHFKVGRKYRLPYRGGPPQGVFRLGLGEVLELVGHG